MHWRWISISSASGEISSEKESLVIVYNGKHFAVIKVNCGSVIGLLDSSFNNLIILSVIWYVIVAIDVM